MYVVYTTKYKLWFLVGGLKKGEGGVDNTNVLFSDETERRTNRSKGVITKDPHVAGLGLGLA